MAGRRAKRQGRAGGHTGEKRTRGAMRGGGPDGNGQTTCSLCARLSRPRPEIQSAPSEIGHALTIALVGCGNGICVAARQMAESQPDGWVLQVYDPSCLVRQLSRREGSPRSNAVQGHCRPGRPADVVLIGLGNGADSRVACVRRLKALAPDLPVLIISDRCEGGIIVRHLMAGADGWLTRRRARAELAWAVRAAVLGEPVLCPEAEKALLDFLHGMGRSLGRHGMPQRQQQILACLGEHLSNKDIARRLEIATNTVHVHVARLLRKFDVHTRAQLVKALSRGGGDEV